MRSPNRVSTATPPSPGVSRALRRLGIVFHRGRSYRGYWQDRPDGVRVIVQRTDGPPWTPTRMRGQPIVVYQTAPDGREIASERYFPDVSAFIASAVVPNPPLPQRRTDAVVVAIGHANRIVAVRSANRGLPYLALEAVANAIPLDRFDVEATRALATEDGYHAATMLHGAFQQRAVLRTEMDAQHAARVAWQAMLDHRRVSGENLRIEVLSDGTAFVAPRPKGQTALTPSGPKRRSRFDSPTTRAFATAMAERLRDPVHNPRPLGGQTALFAPRGYVTPSQLRLLPPPKFTSPAAPRQTKQKGKTMCGTSAR